MDHHSNGKPQQDPGSDEQWILHLYRGFVQTSTMWRQRMDVTSNWTVPLLIGLATFALGDPQLPHLLFLLLGGVLVGAAVFIEARRYRELHHVLWRAHLIEVGHFVQLLSHVEVDPCWQSVLAEDLYRPRPTIRMSTAVLARMRRTYLLLFYLLIITWVCKVVIHPRVATTATEVLERMRVGPLPGAWLAGSVAVMLVTATVLTLVSPSLAVLESRAVDVRSRGSTIANSTSRDDDWARRAADQS